MRLPPAPVHGADDPWNSADDGAGALFASTRVQNRRREPACPSSGCRPSSSRKALHSMARNLELHQHVWRSSSCERLPAISMAGVPTGIRTRVSALKGPRPRPLDDGDSWRAAVGRPRADHKHPILARLGHGISRRTARCQLRLWSRFRQALCCHFARPSGVR